MSWVVDTCVLIDVLEDDPNFGRSSALCLRERVSEGLEVSPITMVELSPAFEGQLARQKEFLTLCGVHFDSSFEPVDAARSHAAWNRYIAQERLKKASEQPIAEIMIGAFALRFDGLITRNPKDFEPWFPRINLIVPAN